MRPWTLAAFGLAACAKQEPAALPTAALALPAALAAHAEIVPDDLVDRSALAAARQPEGKGGVSAGVVVRITADLPVYRMWNGPDWHDANGHTNRLGSWWTAEAPSGPADAYRRDYGICRAWNELAWVATCTLKAGSLVVVGPGQSVSAEACGVAEEAYPANPEDWQIYVDKPWTRPGELVCPPEAQDYAADPSDISKRRSSP